MNKSDTIRMLLVRMEERCRELGDEYTLLGGVMKCQLDKSEKIKSILQEKAELHGAISVIYGIIEK